MDEILKRLPELINMLLEQVSKSNYGKDDAKEAKLRLMSQLQNLSQEFSQLQEKGGDALTEEQIKKFVEFTQQNPNKWKINE